MWAICSCNSSAPNYVWTTFAETSYIRLLVYRLLEKKLGEEFACSENLKTLRDMNMILLSKDSGCIPSYKRTKLTDADRKSTRLNSSHIEESRMPSSA